MLGAEVYPVPAVAFDNPQNYNHQARRHAENLENAVWTNQFDNIANRRAHIETTGPEIWEQTEGTVDAFTCATGTAGTLAGTARFLKTKNSNVKIYVADPPGSVLHSYFQSGGKLFEREGGSITEGIGQGRITDNMAQDVDLVDGSFRIPDEESISMLYRLLDEEGIYVGASSALNVVAATKVAKELGKGKKVVTILADGAYRYQSRLFSKFCTLLHCYLLGLIKLTNLPFYLYPGRKWLESKKLDTAIPEHLQKYIVLP